MRNASALSVVAAAYRAEVDEEEWLRGLARAAGTCFQGQRGTVVASVVRPGVDSFDIRTRVAEPHDEELLAAVGSVEGSIPAPAVGLMHRRHGCVTASEFVAEQGLGVDMLRAVYAPHLHPLGVRDAFNVQGALLGPLSVVFTIALDRETQVHSKLRHTWERVAVHLAAGLRLREALTAAGRPPILDSADAILDPDGNCVHARGAATSASARERLREAAKAVDLASGRLGREQPEEALELWTGLFAGRWSLLDTFDSDGRRFLVAFENDPQTAEDRALTRRERQVAALAAFGQTEKLIAYSLGLEPSTVQTHLQRALSKLGVGSRLELNKIAETLFERLTPDQD